MSIKILIIVFLNFIIFFDAQSVEVGEKTSFTLRGFFTTMKDPIIRKYKAEITNYDKLLDYYYLVEERIDEYGRSNVSKGWVKGSSFPDKLEIQHMINQCEEFNGEREVFIIFSKEKNDYISKEICKTSKLYFDVAPDFEGGDYFYHGHFPIYGLAMARSRSFPTFVLYDDMIIFD